MIVEAARFGDEEQRRHVAWGWLAGREPVAAAREILTAAEEMSPLLRTVAVGVVERLGDDAVPAWLAAIGPGPWRALRHLSPFLPPRSVIGESLTGGYV